MQSIACIAVAIVRINIIAIVPNTGIIDWWWFQCWRRNWRWCRTDPVQDCIYNSLGPGRIRVDERIVAHVSVKIGPTAEADRIPTDKPASRRVVVACPVIVEAGLRVKLASRISEGVG